MFRNLSIVLLFIATLVIAQSNAALEKVDKELEGKKQELAKIEKVIADGLDASYFKKDIDRLKGEINVLNKQKAKLERKARRGSSKAVAKKVQPKKLPVILSLDGLKARLEVVEGKLSKEYNIRKQLEAAASSGLSQNYIKGAVSANNRNIAKLENEQNFLSTKIKALEPTPSATASPVTVSGAISVSLTDAKGYDNQKSQTISVGTIDIGIEGKINRLVTGTIALDASGGTAALSDAFIKIGPGEKCSVSSTIGAFTVPFGVFDTSMNSDPLPKGLADTGETALLVAWEKFGVTAALFGFNGNWDKDTTTSDKIQQYGANLSYTFKSDLVGVRVGAGYLSSFADTNANQSIPAVDIADYIAGYDANLRVDIWKFYLLGEYVTAAKKFNVNDIEFKGAGAKPSAYQAELGFSFAIANLPTGVFVGYQGSAEALQQGLPKSTILAGASLEVLPGTSLLLEYKSDKDYGVGDCYGVTCGTGKTATTTSLTLGVGF
jgi:hypothetical protein